MTRRTSAILLFFITVSAILSGAEPVLSSIAPDETFKPVLSAPGSVKGIAPLPDGQMIVIGDFTTISGVANKSVARLNTDGSPDTTFQLTSDIQVDQIHAVAVQSDGKILIGGYMTYYGAERMQQNLFRLNADGSLDTSFDAGGYVYASWQSYGINNMVRAIQIDGSGKILIGGDFTAPFNQIARLNSDGSVDTAFDPGSGANGTVTHISLQSTGAVVIGGAFTQVNGTAKAGIARLNASGVLDTEAFGTGIYGGSLMALTVQPDDKILIGGSFSAAAGQSVYKLARFNADATIDTAFDPVINGTAHIDSYLYEITSLTASATHIFVGGWNPDIIFNGQPTDHDASIYVLQAATGGFYSYMNFKGKPTDVWALAKRSDGLIAAGGSFTHRDDPLDEGLYPGLCLLSGTYFMPDPAFKPVIGGQADVQAMARQADGKIIAAGAFYLTQGVETPSVARLNTNGSLDPTLSVPVTEGGTVTGVLVRTDGKIVMGGSFYSIDSQDYKDVALLDANGAMEASAYVGGVNALTLCPDGKIIAVMPHSPGIKRLNADLSIDSSFNPGEGISNTQQTDYEFDRVNAAAVQADGKILVGGSFFTFSGDSRQNIIRLNTDGSIDPTFASPAFTVFNYRSEVFSIAIQTDGKILLTGRFSSVGGVSNPTVVRLNADGTVDTTFASPFGDQGLTAYVVHVQSDGRILVGGGIQIVEGSRIFNGLVRLNPDGSRDTSFDTSVTGTVRAIITLESGDQIFAGGSIEQVDGKPRQGLVLYSVLIGDVNHDGAASLADAIIALQVLESPTVSNVYPDGDVNRDNRIGLPEAIYILQKVAGTR